MGGKEEAKSVVFCLGLMENYLWLIIHTMGYIINCQNVKIDVKQDDGKGVFCGD